MIRTALMRSLICLMAAASMLSLSSQAAAQEATASETVSETAPGAAAYEILDQRPGRIIAVLPNRLLVVVSELHSSPVVSAQVVVKTGSIYEQEHVGAGLSHFLEHLVSGGTTKTRSEAESVAVLGRIGAATNASTDLVNVKYYIDTTRPHASEAIALLTDWMNNAVIPQEEYERERDVIFREFEMGRGEPGRIFWKLTQGTRYQVHPARHPTIGYMDAFTRVTRDQIYDFYKRMYVPNNMVFSVAGDIDARATLDEIAKLWAPYEAGPVPDLMLPVEQEIDAPRKAAARADIERPRLRLAWPGTQLAEEGDYAMDLLAVILGRGESSRLVRAIRDERRLATYIYAFNLSFPWGRGAFFIDAELAQGGDDSVIQPALEALKAAVLSEVARVREHGVTSDELARAKRQVIASIAYGTQSAHALANRVADDLVGMADPDYMDHYVRAIAEIQPEALKQAAERFLTAPRLIELSLLPATEAHPAADLPRPEDIEVPDLERVAVNLDNRAILDRYEAQQQGHLAAEAEAPQWGELQSYTLSNGLRLLVRRSTLVPAVSMHLYHLGGLLADAPGQEGMSNAAAAMLDRGTETRTAEQLALALDQLGAELSAGGGNNTFYVQAMCLSSDWRTVLDIFSDVLLRPSFPTEQWDRLQPRLLASLDRQMDSWSSELRSHFRDVYFGSHPWSQDALGRRETLEQATAEDLRAYYFDRLAAKNAVMAVVGDVDPEAIRDAVESAMAAMPAEPGVAFEPKIPDPAGEKVVQVQTAKPLAAVHLGMGPGITRSSDAYAGMRVMGTILSDFPSGYLEQALRGRGPGLVYAVGAGSVVGLVPGYFSVVFNSDPSKVIQAVERTMDVIERIKTQPVAPSDLERAKAKVLTEEYMSQQTYGDLATSLALDALYGVPPGDTERFLKQVQVIDAAAIAALAQAHLTNPVLVLLTHEKVDQEALEIATGVTQQGEAADQAPAAGPDAPAEAASR